MLRRKARSLANMRLARRTTRVHSLRGRASCLRELGTAHLRMSTMRHGAPRSAHFFNFNITPTYDPRANLPLLNQAQFIWLRLG